MDERGRTSLARVRTHHYDRYTVEEFPDGTLVLTLAVTISALELAAAARSGRDGARLRRGEDGRPLGTAASARTWQPRGARFRGVTCHTSTGRGQPLSMCGHRGHSKFCRSLMMVPTAPRTPYCPAITRCAWRTLRPSRWTRLWASQRARFRCSRASGRAG